MHNLGTVISFEIVRTLKKKTFWIAALSFPVIIGLVGAIIFFANKSTDEQTKELANESFSIGITDNSGLLNKSVFNQPKIEKISSQAEGEDAVKSGKLQAYIIYPQSVAKEPVKIFASDVGIFKNSRYQAAAEQILKQSVSLNVDPDVVAVFSESVNYKSTTYQSDGSVDRGYLKLILPGIFLLLFYFMIATFGNQILTSITEEKENRVIEMILTTIQPTTLLIGKLVSLFSLALIQMVVVLLPIVLGYFLLHNQLSLPGIDLSQLPIDPLRISLAAIIFFVCFFMFTSLIMTLGATMPTAKEAGGFFGGILALVFGPLYAASLFVSAPQSVLVQVLSYFPLTSPIPLLIRNAVGNLSVLEAAISITLLLITTMFIVMVGVRVFRYGALEYSRKLSFKEIFKPS